MNRSALNGCNRESNRRKSSLPLRIALLVALGLGVFGLGAVGLQAPLAAAQMAPAYEIEIGDAVLVPGQAVVLVPVFMTNNVPVQSWGMGLDYDDFHIYCMAVTPVDTASAPLSPVIGTTPSAPPLQYIQMAYSAGPLPAGVHQVVAYLICEVQSVPATTTTVSIDPIETGINGTPATQNGGSIQVLVGNALMIGMGSGGMADEPSATGSVTWPQGIAPTLGPLTPVRVPVYLWSTQPVSKITFHTPLGLDYDEFLMRSGVDLAGTVTNQVGGNNVALTATVVDAALRVEIDLGTATLPPADGAVIAWLSILPQTPLTGSFAVELESGVVTINGIDHPVTNLLDGQVTFLDRFIRGDVEFDRSINLSDAARIVEVLTGGSVVCLDAADVDDSGSVTIADLVQLLGYIFNSTTAPADPFPKAGADPTQLDSLPCL